MDTAPRLVLVSASSGQPLEVVGRCVIVGRHSQADLRVPSADVSRRHCRLEFVDGGWRVVDLGSTNGTFVNGTRVTEAALHPGDRLRVAGFVFEVARSRIAA